MVMAASDPAALLDGIAPEAIRTTLIDAAAIAARETLPRFRTELAVDNKWDVGFDPVTAADREAERAIRDLIAERFPDHGIVGEEFGSERPDAEYVWVLDPIDGTKSFIGGFPVWGTLIALPHNGRPAFGMMHQPYIRERFTGDNGAARYRGPSGERRLSVRRCALLNEATLYTTTPLLMNDAERDLFGRVEKNVRLSRYGGDCYAYCMLASGLVDAVIEAGLQPWDVQALVPIIEGAGGVITAWDGGDAQHGGTVLACGDRRLHAQLMDELRAQPRG